MSASPVVHWFRNDLRLADNRALSAAVATGAPVVCVYVLDDETPGCWKMGAASRWWLHGSLAALGEALAARGNNLMLAHGNVRDVVPRIVRETGSTAVFFTRAYEPWAIIAEHDLKSIFKAEGIAFKRYGGALLCEPEAVRTKSGEPYKVYTPFWRALSAGIQIAKPFPVPGRIPAPRMPAKGLSLAALDLLPKKPDWAGGLRAAWTPGEATAQSRLETFLERAIAAYASDRDKPGIAGTSRLSPHLHFGEISPSLCWWRACDAAQGGTPGRGQETYLRELVWREFSYNLLFHWPDLPEKPFRPEFAAFPWRSSAKNLKRWQRGQTGYPIVDAGMRELWQTGYMHNRVRMIAASFLIKHLRIAWQEGEAWFWDTLVDADLASNAASWQWVAGSGADAAPYFRVFNPVLQGRKFDTDGSYVRRYVPEIATLPAEFIHAPWEAPPDVLKAAGIKLGETYPKPMVDHAMARAEALAAYDDLKKSAT